MDAPVIIEPPFAHAAMLIRKPAEEVFEAIVNPEITSNFWFTRSSGRLAVGKTVEWTWEMYGVSTQVTAKVIEPSHRIEMDWNGYSGPTTVTWTLQRLPAGTFIEVTEKGWTGTGDELIKFVRDSTGGFTWTLAGMKAYLEHGIRLNLVADRYPGGIMQQLS